MTGHISGICLSAREDSEYTHIQQMIKELSPQTKIISFDDVLLHPNLLEECDFIFTVGGDGTVAWLIKTYFERHETVESLKPIVPVIRPSSIGYLMQLKYEEEYFKKGFRNLMDGKYSVHNRTVLKTTLYGSQYLVVNEIFIACTPHLGKFKISIHNEENGSSRFNPMTSTMADGVIVSTSIGSTGWSLSHNGLINLDEDSLQVVFVGGIHSSANFVVPRKSMIIDLEVKNSSITDDTVLAYQNSRKKLGNQLDNDPTTTLNIIFGPRIIIDGKIVAFGINEVDIDSTHTVPFVYLQHETDIDKARKLTQQPDVKETVYF